MTAQETKHVPNKPKGPAPYRHEDLILVRAAVPEIIQRTWTNNMEQWAKRVPLQQYHAREKHLASTAFSSDNRLITWVLVPKPDVDVTEEYKQSTADAKSAAEGVRGGFNPHDISEENLERILGAVETYERPGIVATSAAGDTSNEGLKDVSSVSVASVYAPSKYRNHGYGKLMMKLLWKEIEGMDASFSFLYSDLGAQFYTNFGWTARTSTEIVIPSSMTLPSAPAEDSTTDKRAARASAKPVPLEAVADDTSLKALVDHDAQLLRKTLIQKLQNNTSNTTFVAVTPEIRCFQWFYARAWFNATNVWKFDATQIKDDLNYGVRVPGTEDQFVLWHHDFTDDNLFILRWRIDSTSSTEESDAIALAFVKAAQEEAKKWKLSKVVYWNGDVSLAKLLGLEIKHRNHSIPSLGLVNSSQDESNVEWILNEKYSW
ncbi:hypothetical protein BGZ54_006039 [Gamsiella multidivaricata]|nr:hypothetical protein BGZ54_006039 [Gamsiella multidivaricata]